uniref:NR LBD domain-containing protein n=1 Tax=Heterorhabditis bacteriophora TaxID=37862 RepID=A0A1I7XV69_HETBA
MEELNTYLRSKDANHPLRMSHILGLLPGIQRSIQRFQEDVSISRVFQMYNLEELFYEVAP